MLFLISTHLFPFSCRLDLLIGAGLVSKTTVSAGIPTCAQGLRPNNIVVSYRMLSHREVVTRDL